MQRNLTIKSKYKMKMRTDENKIINVDIKITSNHVLNDHIIQMLERSFCPKIEDVHINEYTQE